jgi:hypothetical protein
MPEQDAVVAITSGIKDMQAVLTLMWDKLLPALGPGGFQHNPDASRQLKEKLAHLQVRPAEGESSSPIMSRVLNRRFIFPANEQKFESLTLSRSDDPKTLVMVGRIDGKEMKIPCGYRDWKRGRAPLLGGKLAQFTDEPMAGTFAWSGEDTCTIKACAYETPFHQTFKLKFEGNELTLDSESNVAFGPTKRPQLIGHAE